MATSEATIATTRTLDVDTLMSDDFDIGKYIGSDKTKLLDITSPYIDKNELFSDIKMDAFLQNIGVIGKDSISANRTAANSVLNETTSTGLWGSVKEGWKNNQIQLQIADIRFAEINNLISPEIAEEQVKLLKTQMKDTKSKGFNSWAKSASNFLPMMIDTTYEGGKYGLVSGLAAAGFTAAVGQIPPLTVVPEEIITVPAASILGFGFGAGIGGAKRSMEIETGLMYDELLNMTDDNGNKIDRSIIKPIAYAVGTINGLLEITQIADIIRTIPGGKKLLAKAQRETIKNLIKNKSIVKILTKSGGRYAGHIGFETGIEVVQEADNIIFGELAKNITNQLDNTNLKPATKEEITKRLVDTAIESAKGFSIIAGPGNVIQSIGEISENRIKLAEKDTVEQIERISRILTTDKITSRIDITEMGKVDVEGLFLARPVIERKQIVKEKQLSPEEEYQLKQSESTLRAEEPFTISPNLYIGNVTQRMKKVFANIWGASPEEVHGFLEGAFPTKRTKIELTMGEARHLLTVMENSLQDRLDKNQIHTHNDMARANADWGDIKTLRESIGLPETKRPFVVVKDLGTEVITIENVKERISKSVTPSKLDKILITKIDRLNLVMRKVETATKKGYNLGKQEARKLYAEIQYLKKQKELRNKLVESISKEPSEKIDFFYREAIKGIQQLLDLENITKDKIKQKDSLRKLLNEHPGKSTEIPQNILDSLNKKDISSLSYNELIAISKEIKRLGELGALKSELYHKQRTRALKSFTSESVNAIKKAKKNIFPSMERANTLRPSRIFDMLDGGKNFTGKIFNFFYRQTNEDYNAELQNSDVRIQSGKQKLAELGLRWHDLIKKRMVGKVKLSVDEMLSVYAGWKNPESQAALRYGGLEITSQKDSLRIDDNLYNQIVETLTEKERIWGDTIIQEYGEHYDRMRNSVIRAENRDPGNAENYTKIRRVGIKYNSTEQEMLDELALRHFYSQAGVHKGFTLERQQIPPEYQMPIKSGLTKIWIEEIKKQEHYINNAQHIKEMRAIYNKKEFQNNVIEKFGEPVLDTIDHYINSIANPDFYKTFTDIEQVSKLFRRHTAIAYIAFNVSSYLNQFSSIATYWADSSIVDVMMSTMNTIFHPLQSFESAKNIHYQISHQSIEREMMELQRVDGNAYKKIIDSVGRVGMYGIFAVDRVIRIIGINAVYNYNLRKRLSPAESAQKASMITLLTQEAASPKDLAKLYSSNEVLNWFTMFTNQLNQIYNRTTYDIPTMWRNGNYIEAARSSIALSIMAVLVWMIQNSDIPDEPEDVASALGESAVSSIPLIGSYIVAGAKGWSSSAPAPLKAAGGIGRTSKAIIEGDYEKAVKQLAEPLAIGVGFPYQGAKDVLSFVEELE